MALAAGQLGATQLLAQLVVAVDDPLGLGVGADDMVALPSGVAATVRLPSGDRYAITVEWRGDDEAEPTAGYRLWVNEARTVLARWWPVIGSVEVATRESPAHTWGPPIVLMEEKPS